MKSVALAPGALRELEEAVDWYEARDAGLGGALLIEIGEILARIAEAPAQFPVWELRPAYRKAILPATFPFIVYFREKGGDVVEVEAISHGARYPGYWLRRH